MSNEFLDPAKLLASVLSCGILVPQASHVKLKIFSLLLLNLLPKGTRHGLQALYSPSSKNFQTYFLQAKFRTSYTGTVIKIWPLLTLIKFYKGKLKCF